ncbi:Fatty acyl-CoA reductase 1 [Araneus ventricosus]|uniref:Fatty acyl-CoA reductase n=1 Tax=Araneus ventricosus TaxID=182803 RepID=A0A4Y2DN73_ARAVE|nr:Fatty acyl-CoA reductase 1 [Araneus ventricosus]
MVAKRCSVSYSASFCLSSRFLLAAFVLLETLLRCCPGIKSIYTLLRTKKNVQPEVRKEQIFNKKILEKLKKETPQLLRKVHVISGDASLSNLGMNEDDTHLLLEEVSIVFHCAAAVNFKKPLEFLLKNNVLSLSSVIELCRKMRKFEVLVYTSTAYSNSNHLIFPLREEVYRLPFHAGKFLDALKNEDKEELEKRIAHCKPDWPNSYNFSKCLAENVITDTASDLPIAIIRPSIIIGTWKHPIPASRS